MAMSVFPSACLSVCLSVSLSVVSHAYARLVRKLPNRSTWKFTTTLGPWKSFIGCRSM